MEVGPDWTKKHIIPWGTKLIIKTAPIEALETRQLKQLLPRLLQDTALTAYWHADIITIHPMFQFDTQMVVRKIVELLPIDNGRTPALFYFGAEPSDEPAFREANLNGYSILMRENIGRKTAAQYYLRNSTELDKTLIWLNSL